MAAIATNANANAPAAPGKLTNRRRFLDACHCRAVDRPPVWLMRQAGRALPEYRELKEKHSFLELIQTPELAAEVTLQPVRRFGFDAAILFSDILVIPEAMGQPYRFRETGGLVMDFAVRTKADIERLSVERVVERLGYVDQALRLVRKELGDQTALIGFSGSPWTLATFMMEGGSAEKYTRALKLFHEDRKTFYTLAEKLTAAITAYLQMQINAGVDVLQIFDSHGGQLAPTEFQEASGRWMRDIIASIGAPSTASARTSATSCPTRRVGDRRSARHCFLPRHARELGRPAGDRGERAGHRLAISAGSRAPAVARGHRPARQPGARAAQRRHAGSCRAGNAGRARSHARPQRPYFQPWPRRAAQCEIGKHRRLGRNGA